MFYVFDIIDKKDTNPSYTGYKVRYNSQTYLLAYINDTLKEVY